MLLRLQLLLLGAVMTTSAIVMTSDNARALSCMPPFHLAPTTDITPRGIIAVRSFNSWARQAKRLYLVEVGKDGGRHYALEQVQLPKGVDAGGTLLLRPVKALPVGRRVTFSKKFRANNSRMARQVWNVVAAPPRPPKKVPTLASKVLKSTEGPHGWGYQYQRHLQFPKLSQHAVLARVRETVPAAQTPRMRFVAVGGNTLRLHQGWCSHTFPARPGKKTPLTVDFLDGEGRVVAKASLTLDLPSQR